MKPDQREEQLNDAVDALLSGASRDEVAAHVPEDLDPLVDAADVLARSGRAAADGARPSFVLGLEEQLRTDLRLRRPGLPRLPLRVRMLRWLGALVVAAIVMLVVVEQSGPDGPLYGVKQTIEDGRMRLSGSAATRVDRYLDSAWRRLAEVREMHDQPGTEMSETAWQAALDDLVRAYSAAADAAASSNDPMLQGRVRSAAAVAADELARIADQAARTDLDRARWFRVSAAELRRSIAMLPPDAGDAWRVVGAAIAPTTSPEPTPSPVSELPTVQPTDQPTAASTSLATELATAPAVNPAEPSATTMPATVAPTSAQATEPLRSSTASPTEVPATAAIRQPHTPLPVTPTDTPSPQEETPGSSVITTATATPDSWLATSTPDPAHATATTGALPGTPETLPTLVGPGTAAPTSAPTAMPVPPWDEPSPEPTPEEPRRPTDGSSDAAPAPREV